MMRKRIADASAKKALPNNQNWLDLERLAAVEVTSEQAEYRIGSALTRGESPGWRASVPGEQTIRLLFDEPLILRRVYLVFEEAGRERTHEFVLSWSEDVAGPCREIVRQQYTFSPPGTTIEVEDYVVNLNDVRLLELRIAPDISGGNAQASLRLMRLA